MAVPFRFQSILLVISGVVLLVVVVCIFAPFPTNRFPQFVVHAATSYRNPYEVLGVRPTASFKDIRTNYRRLCLTYHPDKTRNLPIQKQKECERLFKELQTAYAQIGDQESRRQYDQTMHYQSHSTSRSYNTNPQQQAHNHNFKEFVSPRMNPAANQPLHASFEQMFRKTHIGTPFSTTMYRVNLNDLFRKNYNHNLHNFAQSSPLWNPSLKSIYVQKVFVPLHELYNGRTTYTFHLHDNLISRIVAAFRGGMAYLLLYQSILYALPIIRCSGKVAFILGLYLFVHLVPRVESPKPKHFVAMKNSMNSNYGTIVDFTTHLRPGYKSGTKIIFDERRTGTIGVEVQFWLYEAKHKHYHRIGSNLHVTCPITPNEAAKGVTTFSLPQFGPNHWNITILPGTQNGDIITLVGQGWPSRTKGKGDLIVTLSIQSKSSLSQWRFLGKNRK